MFRFYHVTVDEFSTEFPVARMKVQPVGAGNQGEHLLQIAAELFDRTGLSRVVSCRLDTATRQGCAGTFETTDIVTLPTMDGDGNGCESVDDRIRIYSEQCVGLSCRIV